MTLQNGSAVIATDAATISYGTTNVALTSAQLFGDDGTTYRRLSIKNSAPASGQYGLIVRGLGWSDNAGTDMTDVSNHAVRVNIVAGGGSGGTSVTDEGAFTQGSTGITPIGCLFKSSYTTLSSGQAGVAQCTSTGQLYVNVVNGGMLADKSSFTEGTTVAVPISGVLNDTISADPTEDQAAALRITAKRGLHVNLRNVSGTEIGTTSNPIQGALRDSGGADVSDTTNHAIKVNIVAGAAAGGTSITDAGTFTQASSAETPIGCLYITSYTQPASGKSTVARCTNNGELFVNVVNTTPEVTDGATFAAGQSNIPLTDTAIFGYNGTAYARITATGNRLDVNTARSSGAAAAPIACDNWTPFSISGTTVTKLVSKATSKQVYICSINLVVAAASNVAVIEGTKTTNECDTSTAGVSTAGTTAATGWNFPANGGLTHGSGYGVVMATATANHDVCIVQSASTQLSGGISWTQL